MIKEVKGQLNGLSHLIGRLENGTEKGLGKRCQFFHLQNFKKKKQFTKMV